MNRNKILPTVIAGLVIGMFSLSVSAETPAGDPKTPEATPESGYMSTEKGATEEHKEVMKKHGKHGKHHRKHMEHKEAAPATAPEEQKK